MYYVQYINLFDDGFHDIHCVAIMSEFLYTETIDAYCVHYVQYVPSHLRLKVCHVLIQ
jgi:hypothetical protein